MAPARYIDICLITVLMSSLTLSKCVCGHSGSTSKGQLLKLIYIQQTCVQMYWNGPFSLPILSVSASSVSSCLSLLPCWISFPHFLSNLQQFVFYVLCNKEYAPQSPFPSFVHLYFVKESSVPGNIHSAGGYNYYSG